MAVKTKVKAKAAVKPKKAVKKIVSKPNAKVKPTRKLMTKPEAKVKSVVEKPNAVEAPVKTYSKTCEHKANIGCQTCDQPVDTAQTDQTVAAPQPIHIYESAWH